MRQRNKKRTNRIRNLIFVCALSSIVLIVSTYAWFIGLQSVAFSSFDIEIAAADSLLLSVNGEDWSDTISITKDNLAEVSYSGHTNKWGGPDGIFPVSTIGDMDSDVSRMILFEMASLDKTTGGYRVMASRVLNNVKKTVNDVEVLNPEQDGYVTFDLFIRNFTGEQYLSELNVLDEESIYLTTDSEVKVANSGVQNTGIENSVRVAFTQIGRVSGETDTTTTEGAKIVTDISCTTDANVTGICRNAQIWEPNDKLHEDNAISWYETSCRQRTGANLRLVASYSANTDTCGEVADGTAYPTYVVTRDITSADNVDVYDGSAYNKYTGSFNSSESCTGADKVVPTDEPACTTAGGTWADGACTGTGEAYCEAIHGEYEFTRAPLQSYPFFTDTMKMLTGTARPTFMTLAPNSITKLRVYIYIEGQDIDNYDFAAVGRMIAVKFGFTKERFTEGDIGYDGPASDGVATVTFDTDGGTAVPDPQEVIVREKATEPTAPTKDGYTFAYWSIKGQQTPSEYDFDTEVLRDLSLIAIYTENE